MSKMITSKLLAAWCLVSLWGFPLFPLSARAATTVKFTLVRNYLIVVAVTVAGSGSHEFLLDTGTNTTLLQTEFAQQLGLPLLDRIELMTVAGAQIVPRAQLPQLSLAGQTVTNLEVLFADLREIRAVLPQVRGVLGQNFLSQGNYLVNYARREISLVEEAEARWCGERLPFTMHEGRVFLTINPLGDLVLDSGIAELLLFDAARQKARLSLKQEAGQPRQLKSDVGQQTVWQGRLSSLQIGKLVLPNLPVTLLPQNSAEAGRTEAGLLPMSLFRSIYVNHRQNYVILNPSPPPSATQAAKPPAEPAVTKPR